MMLIIVIILIFSLFAENDDVKINIIRDKNNINVQHSKSQLLFIMLDKSEILSKILNMVKRDLEWSGQCVVTIREGTIPNKEDIKKFQSETATFVVFFNVTDNLEAIEGRIYDSVTGDMVQGIKWKKRSVERNWIHKISADLWKQFMGSEGSFLTQIAYTKKNRKGGRFFSSNICLVDWDGYGKKDLLCDKKILIAPSWKCDGSILFYSEFTDRNVRLMACDRKGLRWPVVDHEGTTVGISSIISLSDIIYCHSGCIWKYNYDVIKKMGRHTRIIVDSGLCASPTLLSTGDVIYCSRGKIRQWDSKMNKTYDITNKGYCTGPACHEASGSIIYSKRVGKYMQLFIFNKFENIHKQITFDTGDKLDPCWSPCGTYVAYNLNLEKKSIINVFNVITNIYYQISADGDYCSCPSWSPIFDS